MTREIEEARKKYRPAKIACLFIAEAPPSDLARFFYYEHVRQHDYLFLELMKVLYLTGQYLPAMVRHHKTRLLQRFMNDGYYLLDASPEPMPKGAGTNAKTELLRPVTRDLVRRVDDLRTRELIDTGAPLVLILAPVFRVCRLPLIQAGFNVLNGDNGHIPSASSGQQAEFRRQLEKLLSRVGIEPVDVLSGLASM